MEKIAYQIGLIQNSLEPKLTQPHLLVFAADHGIALEGVSAYPSEITYQMVFNFIRGGAAINVFARQHQIQLRVIDAGVNYDFPADLPITHAKIARGTQNYLHQAAMSPEQCIQAISQGATLMQGIKNTACNIIGFGEMGIGNTSSAALLMHGITQIPLVECVGAGTGLDQKGLQKKLSILGQAWRNHTIDLQNPLELLQTFGGLEIAMMVGAMLESAASGMILLIDGFIATSALLVAQQLYPEILDYCLFSHQSDEQGHQKMLHFLQVEPILKLNLRLGEGTGVALAYPIIQSAVHFLNEMASFEDLG